MIENKITPESVLHHEGKDMIRVKGVNVVGKAGQKHDR